ncbi:MAG TPA: bi-domain-containing oxidoreductase [Longilinea sp.]|nr:bi-domain-containing oxidoreductase [Longilinea sp.]
MKQVLQSMKSDKTMVEEVPIPEAHPGTVLVRVAASLVSAGTERMLVDFAGKSLLGKVRSRPDLARQVIDKARREGVLPTLEAAFSRLDQPMPLGYSSAGTIVSIGEGVTGFHPGDRVACSGSHAVHAEYNVVPSQLVTKLPDPVDFNSAAFTTLGAIAMQGFRLAAPQLGERVAVIGLGLLGLLTAKLAIAAGCPVFGIDVNSERVKFAISLGVEAVARTDAEESAKAFTNGLGFDAVIICADTHSNDTVVLAGQIARDRGTVISTGVVGLDLPRKLYFEKELKFMVSRSSGPGRYDPIYEEKGIDYPIGFARWTEGRNFEAFIGLLANHSVDVLPLISHHFPIGDAAQAYELITGKTGSPFLAVILEYPQEKSTETSIPSKVFTASSHTVVNSNTPGIGVLGAGNYASAVFLPILQKSKDCQLIGIASAGGASAVTSARRFGFQFATAKETDIITNDKINAVVVMTRHNEHPRQVIQAIENGKHVYCEKPLAINAEGLDHVAEAVSQPNTPLLMVGFNRRFAPFVQSMKAFLGNRNTPLSAHYRVNAGAIPLNHWIQDPEIGGGRIIGEGCHFIDLLTFLTGTLPVSVRAWALPDLGTYRQDNIIITLTYPDGSIGSIEYLANGDKSVPKETLEVFSGGKVAFLNDFRRLELTAGGNHKVFTSTLRQDKGHKASWDVFLKAISQNGIPPIPYADIFGVHRACLAVMRSIALDAEVKLN